MIAVAQGWQPGAQSRMAVGMWRLDSGVRLLAAGAGLQRLRWSTDPDAPAARTLCAGEIRLSLQRVEVGPDDLRRLSKALSTRGSAEVDAWAAVAGVGVGVVEESNVETCREGVIVRGPMPLGTHLVLRILSTDSHGFLARTPSEEAVAPVRYAWCAGPLRAPAVTGLDDVERAVMALRDVGHGASPVVPLSLVTAGSSKSSAAPITVASCLWK